MTTAAKPKRLFGAIPARAIGDSRLNGTHFRLLACVALHDRMSEGGNGQGCWASLQTLSKECGIHHTNASTALNELDRWGYLQIERQDTDARRRVARVLYTGEDEAVVRIGSVLPKGKRSTLASQETVSVEANKIDEIVCPHSANNDHGQDLSSSNIFRINGHKDIPQNRSERYSAEAGLERRNPNGVLAQIQRRLKANEVMSEDEVESIRETVERILEVSDGGGQTYGWADSILMKLDSRVHQ